MFHGKTYVKFKLFPDWVKLFQLILIDRWLKLKLPSLKQVRMTTFNTSISRFYKRLKWTYINNSRYDYSHILKWPVLTMYIDPTCISLSCSCSYPYNHIILVLFKIFILSNETYFKTNLVNLKCFWWDWSLFRLCMPFRYGVREGIKYVWEIRLHFRNEEYSVLFRDHFKSLHGRVIYLEITRRTLSKNKIVMTNNVYAHGLTFD